MKLLKIINKAKTYQDKKGNTQFQNYFALELDNGYKIAIKPSFSDDYKKLVLVAETIIYND